MKKNQTFESTSDEAIEKIKKLSGLRDIGAITEEEFEIKKSELLSEI